MKKTADIVIVGAGVIGLSTALRLAQKGMQVLVVERREVGREASWAGAGMLPPGNLALAETPEARLRAYSHQLWADFARELHELTGIDTGYSRCGAVELNDPMNSDHLGDWRTQLRSEEIVFEDLNANQLGEFAPHLDSSFSEAVYLPNFGQIRNPRYLKALQTACRLNQVQFLQHDHVTLHRSESGMVTVESTESTIVAHTVCVAAGAWSRALLEKVGCPIPVHPVRGQIAQLRPVDVSFDHVIQIGRRYLVPRKDGLVLVGATEEFCGYSKQVTSAGMRGLLEFAEGIVPSLATAEVVRQWAGLRPGSADELPFLGAVPNCENLYVATGHFRSGLQMSIGTAEIMCQLITGQQPEICLAGLEVDRIPGEVCQA